MRHHEWSRSVTLEPMNEQERVFVVRVHCSIRCSAGTTSEEPVDDDTEASDAPLLPQLVELLPISDLIIASKGTVDASEGPVKGTDATCTITRLLLETQHQVMSELYPPFMRQRAGSIWIIRPRIVATTPSAVDTFAVDTFAVDSFAVDSFAVDSFVVDALAAGCRALAVVAAQELARKNVVVNYVDSSSPDLVAQLAPSWRTSFGPIMTGQTIELEDVDACRG